jgi:nucleoid DNA-binding protein
VLRKMSKSMSKNEIISEISEATEIKKDVVRSVLDCFADLMTRECIMTESFNFSKCFSVNTRARKAHKAYSVSTKEYINVPETQILTIKLSPKIHSFHRWKHRNANNKKHGVNRENWREAYKNLENEESG